MPWRSWASYWSKMRHENLDSLFLGVATAIQILQFATIVVIARGGRIHETTSSAYFHINFTSKCAKFKLFCLGSACHVCFRHPCCLSLAGIMFIFRFTPSSTPSSHDPTITNIFLLGIVVGVVFVIIEIIQGLIVVIAICISNDDYLFKLLFVIIFLLLSSISFS